MSCPKTGERRVSQDEQLGYIRGKVESIQEELSDFKKEVRDTLDAMAHIHEVHVAKEEKTVEKILDNLDVYRFMWLAVRGMALGVVLALTLTFGDIWEFAVNRFTE
jgi:hypothetical protein